MTQLLTMARDEKGDLVARLEGRGTGDVRYSISTVHSVLLEIYEPDNHRILLVPSEEDALRIAEAHAQGWADRYLDDWLDSYWPYFQYP